MKHWHWISLAFLAVVLTVVAMAVPRLAGGPEKAAAQQPSGITASLDMDTTDGPCTDIDSSTSHGPGDSYYVAICVEGLYGLTGTGIGILAFDVIYSDILNTAPEVANSGTALDDNPDANVGSTTWGASLGTGWDCSNGGLAYPTGDRDAVDGAGHGDAFISCSSTTGPWTLGDNETSGVIARIHFVTTGYEGIDSMTISNGLLGYGDTTEMGSCNPAATWEMDCVGGTDDKTGTPVLTPTVTNTPTITPTPWCGGPGQPECPTATSTRRPWTKTPSPTPTDTPGAPEGGGEGEQPPPPPPPPPAAEQMPQVVPPGTGSGPAEGMPWLTGLLWVMAGAGAASVALGGLFLRSGRGRVR